MNQFFSFYDQNRKVIIQFFKFGLVGILNTAISLSLYYFLLMLGVNYLFANGFAFVVSVLNAYYWNRRYVFKNYSTNHFKAITRTYATYFGSFILSTILLYMMVEGMNISDRIAPLLTLLITIPLNFIANKLWAFR